ncbi:MAG: alpha/beta hydrolase [Candidatus Izemoplasmatales bacterium]|jgi:alpha-beta hydrolase superfamily lysophospholipase|nr:alpha/beta hydrolase [Candidatus Izemoplasmatales bacterium]MDD3864859.1 alpha/beta hydrolase [Candidatus Izemoplasmatales bacterium]
MNKMILHDSAKNNIHVYLYEPTSKPYKGVVQIIHGASEHFARYGLFAEFLTTNGYAVIGSDILGHGLSTTTNDYVHFADKNGADLAFESVTMVKDTIAAMFPGIPVFLLGHSMGSFLARKMIIMFPNFYQKAVISGTTFTPKMTTSMGMMLCNIIKAFYGPKHISPMIQKMAIDSCPAKLRKDGIIKDRDVEWLTKNVDIQNYYHDSLMCGQPFTVSANCDMFSWMAFDDKLDNIRLGNKEMPLYFMSGANDPLSNYGVQVTKLVHIFQNMGYKNITFKLYENDRHEVLNELDNQVAYQDILAFFKK